MKPDLMNSPVTKGMAYGLYIERPTHEKRRNPKCTPMPSLAFNWLILNESHLVALECALDIKMCQIRS